MHRESLTSQAQYNIIQTLGQGQNGQTTLARPIVPNSALSAVVIKQIYHPQESLNTLTQRLKALGQHPQLPSLVDSWQTSNGQFLAFEYVEAPTITQAEPLPWSPAQVNDLLLSLLSVLEHLHSFRLVHGDIRPANIRQGQRLILPILIDLRITQRLEQRTSALTATGGDAAYAAPEQALGKVVYASDLYSLGLVAIHLLTGLPPFDLYSVADNRWIWPELVADPLPKNLRGVLHKLLERSLQTRYARADRAIIELKSSLSSSLLTKAYSLLTAKASLLPSLPAQTPKTPARLIHPTPSGSSASSAPQLHWQRLCQLTTGITTALAFQENTLAMGTRQGTVLVCDLATCGEMYTLRGRRHRDRITAIAFHPQAPKLYSTSHDGTLKLWDLTSGHLIQTLGQPGWRPTGLAIAQAYLIVSDGTGHINLWDLEQLVPRYCFNQHQDWVSAIATNGHRLASISRDRTLRLWCLSEQRLLETRPISPSQALALHPSGNYAIVGNHQGQIDVWTMANASTPERLCQGEDGITALALSPDARLLAVGTDGNALRVYQGASGQCVSELVQGWGVRAIAFDGHTLVSSSQDETVTIWRRALTQKIDRK